MIDYIQYRRIDITHNNPMKLKIVNNGPNTYECFNATFQGFFDGSQLEQNQRFCGDGIVIDDQFNFFLSKWKEDQLDGLSFMRLITGQMIYGEFEDGHPKGTIAITQGKYRIFLSRQPRKQGSGWSKDAILINHQAKIFYLLDLTLRETEKSIDLDRTQKIGTETMRSQPAKHPWKITIIDRCGLKKDGSLACFSKKLKNIQKCIALEYDSSCFSDQQKNHLRLISSVMGSNFREVNLISPQHYLLWIAQKNEKTQVKIKKQSSQQTLFMTLKQNSGFYHSNRLGLAIALNSGEVKSIGSYDSQSNLSGLCVQFSKRGDTSAGIFKQNLLVKQYSRSPSTTKSISSLQVRELLQNQHLKSLNYINTSFYLQEVQNIVTLADRVVKYAEIFEREYEKRHFSYNDSENSQFSDGMGMNVMKYGRQSGHQVDRIDDMKEIDERKPGFIVKKDKSRQGHSKSPAREVGKISKGHSPSIRGYSPLRIPSRRFQ